MQTYQESIREILWKAGEPCQDIAAVEAFMRLDPRTGTTRTLDGMSAKTFRREAILCAREVALDPTEARSFAETMGL